MEIDRKGIKFTFLFLTFLFLSVFFVREFSGLVFESVFGPDIAYENIDERLASLRILRQSALLLREENKNKVTMGFVGDVMLDRGVEFYIDKYAEGNFKFPFQYVAEITSEYDILFGNLEGPISDTGQDLRKLYSFRMDPDAILGLEYAGFDVVSVANNHAFDWGGEAFRDTLSRLDLAGIVHVGENYRYKIIEAKGARVAFLAFSQFSGFRESEFKENIMEARKNSDIVVVSFHFGDEYAPPTDFQKRISHLAVDSGADLVIGHHPHVIQPSEYYKEKYIIYSLGNFVFDQNFSAETMEGLVVEVEFDKDKISAIKERKVKIDEKYRPYFVE